MIDIDNDQNYILNLNGNSSFDNMETITCLNYNAKKGIYKYSHFFFFALFLSSCFIEKKKPQAGKVEISEHEQNKNVRR